MPDAPISGDVSTAVSRSADVLMHRPAALLFDFDGVLSDLVDEPANAAIEGRSEVALHQLAKLIDVVGIVTGRAAKDVMTRLDASDLVVIGNHGLEHVVGGKHVEHEAGIQAAQAIDRAMTEIQDRLERDSLTEGVIFENKRLSASIHYRMAPNRTQVGPVLVRLARNAAKTHGLRTTEGKNIVELRPRAEITKGTAIRQLWEEYRFGSVVFLGDDLTDVDGFIQLKELRESEDVATLAVGVLGPDSHQRVAETADVAVEGVVGVSDLLEQLEAHLEETSSQ